MTPQNDALDTFLIRILSTSFLSVSIFSVCCYSRVSISMEGPLSFVLLESPFNSQLGPPLPFLSGLTSPVRKLGHVSFFQRQ
jgi:hypothetical protein